MAASDAESVDDEVDDGQSAVDVATDLSNMTEAQRRKWDKSVKNWRIFVDFLLRHISIVTYKYNCFEREDLTSFMLALEKAEGLRLHVKLKKGDTAKIASILKMKESAELLTKNNLLMEANQIRKYIDLIGRMRGLSTIAGGLYKAVKKGKAKGLDRIKYSLDFWKGFCVRSFDFTQLTLDNVDVSTLNEMESRYLAWPSALRTSIHLSQTFLKRVCDSTGLDLINTNDTKAMLKHMQTSEFTVATKMEEMLFDKVLQESSTFSSLNVKPTASSTVHNQNKRGNDANDGWKVPTGSDVDPALLKPIADNSILLVLPDDPPKEKKRKKRGKGGKKGKKSAGHSASSHKGGKKKKKK